VLHESGGVHLCGISDKVPGLAKFAELPALLGKTVMPFLTSHSSDSTPVPLVVHFPNEPGKESPKLTMDQIEMLANFSHASEEYPDLSFER